MSDRHPPAIPKAPRILHGGDYNPDQWRHAPAIIERDLELMPKAGVNAVSVGIFAWSALEPEEGRFDFGWLDEILDRLARQGTVVALATPSAARPPWLAHRYRATSRVTPMGLREPYAGRANHCYSSPVMREKVGEINERLAARYAGHPALGLWHISNEYSGECYCAHCVGEWQRWLRARYGTLEALNEAWWADFWSHRYADWDQIVPLDGTLEGEKLDWRRFVTDRTVDFMNHEIAAVRRHDPDTPVTTNFMSFFGELDYRRFAPHVDVIANDWYPAFDADADLPRQAAASAFVHDLMRGMKGGRPWLLLESTPSTTNWQPTAKLKRPGQHRLESLQALAHGAESVMYFQWRKGPGSAEKFHGAVVDLADAEAERTRVFRDVAEVGRVTGALDDLVGLPVPSRVGLIVDWESRWALDQALGLGQHRKRYQATCEQWHRAFWRRNVPVHVLGDTDAYDGLDLLVAPMLHAIKPGVVERLRAHVAAGGVLVTTYLTGLVDHHAAGLMGGWPGGGLRELAGVWVEEQDVLYETDAQSLVAEASPGPVPAGTHPVRDFAELIHLEGARALARYGHDFYAGSPAVTSHAVGSGRVIHVGARTDDPFVDGLVGSLCDELGIAPAAPDIRAPEGVSLQKRSDGRTELLFALNFTREAKRLELPDAGWRDAVEGEPVAGELTLPGLGSRVLR